MMRAYRVSAGSPRRGGGMAIGLSLLLVLAITLVLLLAERGLFRRPAPALVTAVPGVTVDDSDSGAPVVTSLQSGSEAERRGIEVGDDIVAIDGHPVRTAAALRQIVFADRLSPLALHIRRGNAVWTVSLTRSGRARAATGETNGAQDPAG